MHNSHIFQRSYKNEGQNFFKKDPNLQSEVTKARKCQSWLFQSDQSVFYSLNSFQRQGCAGLILNFYKQQTEVSKMFSDSELFQCLFESKHPVSVSELSECIEIPQETVFSKSDLNTSANLENKTQLQSIPCQKKKETGKMKRKIAKTKHYWTQIHELQFFFATLQFSIIHKHKDLSWQTWKPNRYYTFVSQHLYRVLGAEEGRSEEQCKVKAQHLKNIWFVRRIQKIDLVDVTLFHLKQWVQNTQSGQSNHQNLSDQDLERFGRYRKLLEEYRYIKSKGQTGIKHLISQFLVQSQKNKPKMMFLVSRLNTPDSQ